MIKVIEEITGGDSMTMKEVIRDPLFGSSTLAIAYKAAGEGLKARDGTTIVLESARLAGGLRTSRKALLRFIERLSKPQA